MERSGKIRLTAGRFDVSEALSAVGSKDAGGYVVFFGRVRSDGDRGVSKLVYEAYEDMAIREMEGIRRECLRRFPVLDVLIWHRLGEVPVGEETMLIIVSGVHRREAFEACEWVVDEIKKRVPIWKKEVTKRGVFWIEGGRHVPEKP